MEELNQWNPNIFEVVSLLGQGSFGHVFLVRDKQAHERREYALKVVDKKEINANNLQQYIRREIEIQSHLRHPNIVRCYGYFHDSYNVYMVLECLETTLYEELRRQPYKRFSEKNAARIMWYLADAVAYLHERKVIHRDIKPSNILMGEGIVKLADFGLAVILKDEKRRTICGSEPYVAPEICQQKSYTERVDNFSLGIICHELLSGKRPERQRNSWKISISISKLAKECIGGLLQENPVHRLSASAVKEHIWIEPHLKDKKTDSFIRPFYYS